MEGRICLPRNRVVNMYRNEAPADVHEKLKKWANDRTQYCRGAAFAYGGLQQRHTNIMVQYDDACAEAVQFEKELTTSVVGEDFPQLLQDRAARESTHAICDAMFFVPIPGALNSSNGFIYYTKEQDARIATALNTAAASQQVTPPILEAPNPPNLKASSGPNSGPKGTKKSTAPTIGVFRVDY